MQPGSNQSPPSNSLANREINREFRRFRPQPAIFGAQSANEFNGLRRNSLRNGTGHFFGVTGHLLERTGNLIEGSRKPRILHRNSSRASPQTSTNFLIAPAMRPISCTASAASP